MELAQKELRSFSKEDELGLERITWQFELTGKSDPIVENQSLWTVFLLFKQVFCWCYKWQNALSFHHQMQHGVIIVSTNVNISWRWNTYLHHNGKVDIQLSMIVKNLTSLKRFVVSQDANGNEIARNVYKQIICFYARAYKYAEQQYCLYNAHRDFLVSSQNVQ